MISIPASLLLAGLTLLKALALDIDQVRDNDEVGSRRTTTVVVAVILMVAFIGIGVNFFSAATGHPLPFTDAPAFVPTAMAYKSGYGLTNRVWRSTNLFDHTDSFRFLYHGPLFPMTVAALSPDGSYRGILMGIAFLRVITIGLLAGALVAICCRLSDRRMKVAAAVLAGVCILAESVMRLPPVGRPEALASLLALVAFLLIATSLSWIILLACGIVVGVLGASHPIAAVIFNVGLAVWIFAVSDTARKAIARLFLVYAVSLATAAICLQFVAPYGFLEHIEGLRSHGRVASTHRDSTKSIVSTLRYLLAWWDRFFFGPASLVVIIIGVSYAIRITPNRSRRVVVVICAAIFLLLTWFLAVRVAPNSYNLSQFQPIVYLILVILFCNISQLRASCDRNINKASITAFVVIFALVTPSLLPYLKFGTEYYWAVRSQTTYSQVEGKVGSLLSEELPVSGGWMFLNDHNNYIGTPRIKDTASISKLLQDNPNGVVLILQLLPSIGSEMLISSEQLVDFNSQVLLDNRARFRPTLFGYPVTRFDSGYSLLIIKIVPKDN